MFKIVLTNFYFILLKFFCFVFIGLVFLGDVTIRAVSVFCSDSQFHIVPTPHISSSTMPKVS